VISWWMLEPVDVVTFRGNLGFGQSSELAETAMVPRPSVVLGAIRSALLARLMPSEQRQFLADEEVEGPVGAAIGSLHRFGTVRPTWVSLARDRDGRIEPLVALPRDLVATDEGDNVRASRRRVMQESPARVGSTVVEGLSPLVLDGARTKQTEGVLLDGEGLAAWLRGDEVPAKSLVKPDELQALVQVEGRVGIGLDRVTRRVEKSRLYVSQYVRTAPGVGFLVGLSGVDAVVRQLLDGALVRLGGDGRAAKLRMVADECLAWLASSGSPARRVALLAVTPGAFRRGWVPDGLRWDDAAKAWTLQFGHLRARMVAAAVGGAEVVTGWSMATAEAKQIVATVPVGSVWCFDVDADPDSELGVLADRLREASVGIVLGEDPGPRDAEGFSQCWLARWPEDTGKEGKQGVH